ncbi:MAG: CPBP family intramembrane metalloprotease [Opitutales bacterium]|nr:CPBP family intramembrane metalloprotease [Opitutales bacterium]MCH8539927.1 CPBP family intramembrane metalloprotease [Opitutales bacterium]
MFESVLLQVCYLGAAGFLLWLWLKDLRANQAGVPQHGALPGAWPASLKICLIGVIGAMILLAFEVLGEYQLDLVDQQSEITLLFGLVSLGAAVIEEIIFRGYLVVSKRGKAFLVGSILFFSACFAVIHGHFWDWEEEFTWTFDQKAWFTTIFLFLNSVWFYVLRFLPANTRNSLLPCFIAHAASNLGVFLVKAAQGYVIWP